MEPKVPERGVSIDQPAVTVVEISDPAIAGQGIELIDQDAVQEAKKEIVEGVKRYKKATRKPRF